MNRENCIGCTSYNLEISENSEPCEIWHEEVQCPCYLCLVKAMCVKPCDPYDKLWHHRKGLLYESR